MSELYGEAYWLNPNGNSYLDPRTWHPVFANIAAKLKIRFPKTWSVMDAGCGTGYLVEAFRDCGIPAWGVDISEYAIEHARPGAVGFVRHQSLTEPIEGHYDLLTTIEVLEHLTPEDGDVAIANLCAASDNIIFTSTPSDVVEPTHVNVQPAEYWIKRFANHGFERDETFDGSFIVEWALLFRKACPP